MLEMTKTTKDKNVSLVPIVAGIGKSEIGMKGNLNEVNCDNSNRLNTKVIGDKGNNHEDSCQKLKDKLSRIKNIVFGDKTPEFKIGFLKTVFFEDLEIDCQVNENSPKRNYTEFLKENCIDGESSGESSVDKKSKKAFLPVDKFEETPQSAAKFHQYNQLSSNEIFLLDSDSFLDDD